MAQMGNLALDGGDPRLANGDEKAGVGGQGMVAYTRPQMKLLHDPSVSFAEYHWYAEQTRAEEDANMHQLAAGEARGLMSILLPTKGGKSAIVGEKGEGHVTTINTSDRTNRAHISDEEWTNASRAVRTATIGAIFYLITTDILGPFALPYAFASTGWGPGVALYTVFGFMAGFSGYLLWTAFLGECRVEKFRSSAALQQHSNFQQASTHTNTPSSLMVTSPSASTAPGPAMA